jgi:hypothetical protein
MGLSNLALAEILSNPRDLQVKGFRDRENGGYALVVARGPQHYGKVMLTTSETYGSNEELARVASCVFGMIFQSAGDVKSLAHALIEGEVGELLTPQCVEQIVEHVRVHGSVATHMLWPPGTPLPG